MSEDDYRILKEALAGMEEAFNELVKEMERFDGGADGSSD